MSDELLAALDEALLLSRGKRLPRSRQAEMSADEVASQERTRMQALRDWLWWIELFVAVQFLWGALMFLPGAQEYRNYVRALPYLSSLGLLCVYGTAFFRGVRPAGTAVVVGALMLLVVNLAHPTTQFAAGLAQCVFQLSIAAPLFWAHKAIGSVRRFERVLVLIFVMNVASAGLGILQVYFPERFMPPHFSLQLREDYVGSMTYVGNDGRTITRPPGLTDTPGGAAVAGGLTALFGLGLSLRARKPWQTAAFLAAVGVGLAVVYLTQVRSILMMAIVAMATQSVLSFRQGRFAVGAWTLTAGAVLVVGSFMWASSVGGAAVNERFLDIRNQGALAVYRENRGNFLAHTLGELLDEYPFGAGVGRWGMMNTTFGRPDFRSTEFHVEIQATGWLLDGGVLMWVLYGGAIVLSLYAGFRMTAAHEAGVAAGAVVVLAVQVFIAGMAFAGPVFNTQLGILFWTLSASLHGASAHSSRGDEA